MGTRVVFVLAVLTAAGAGLLTGFLCVWFLSLRVSSLDALWQLPVLLCYPVWVLAVLAVLFTYCSRRALFIRMAIVSGAEALLAGFIWLAVRNYWVLG
jgi:hypothetical protein